MRAADADCAGGTRAAIGSMFSHSERGPVGWRRDWPMLVALLRTLNQAWRRCPAAMRCLLQERAHRECISASESASLPPRQRNASRTQSNATQRNAAPAVYPLANAVVCVSLAAAAAATLSRLADILTPSLSRGPQSAPAALVPAATIGGRREACPDHRRP